MPKTEALLNLLWALVCVGALGLHFWRERLRPGTKRAIRLRRAVSVLLAAVSLFPCISATDDRARLADFNLTPAQQPVADHVQSQNLPLSLQLEDLEHGQTSAPWLLLFFVVFFFLLVRLEAGISQRWFSYDSLGRAPPLLAAHA